MTDDLSINFEVQNVYYENAFFVLITKNKKSHLLDTLLIITDSFLQ